MADLSVECGGIRSPNPFWLAPSPVTASVDTLCRAMEAGWGGAVWRTVGRTPPQGPGYALLHAGRRVTAELSAVGPGCRPLAEEMRDVAEVKRQFPGHGLVVSVAAQGREEWLALVAAAEGAGADGVELVLPGDLATAEEVVGWVKQASSKPVWAKVAWDGGDARGLARVAAKAGAAAVTVAGGARLLWGVDLDRGCALPAVAGRGVVVTGGGAWLRPALLALVADVALDAEVARPVTASCGVASWQDAAEAMALGATVVQVGGEAVRRGVGLARELVDGLDDFLDAQGWGAVTDLVGRALPSLAGWAEVEGRRPVVARIDVATCVGCQLCQVACRDGGPDAVRLPARETAVLEELERALASRPVPPPAERVPFVDERVCTGCGLCLAVCPVDGCIRTGEPGR